MPGDEGGYIGTTGYAVAASSTGACMVIGNDGPSYTLTTYRFGV
jgi:hypothetical protein